MVIGKLTTYLGLGLVGAFLLMSLTNPQRALATTQAIGGGGAAIGQWGAGISSLLTGIGKGGSRLFDPLFTLRDLIYGPQAGVQTEKDVAEVVSTTPTVNTQDIIQTQKQIEQTDQSQFTPLPFAAPTPQKKEPNLLDRLFGWFGEGQPAYSDPINQGFSYSSKPGISPVPVSQVRVHGQSVPLSQAAISYYQSRGVSVSPASSQTAASRNSGNATSNSSASSNYSAGAAQRAGYSTGSPR
jgi:hypothetical protein